MRLVDQIREAQEKAGWSTQQLLDKSGLPMDRSSLHRKLRGEQPATAEECEALAKTLGITLVWPKKSRKGAA